MNLTPQVNEPKECKSAGQLEPNNFNDTTDQSQHQEMVQEQSMLLDESVFKYKFIANLKRIQLNSDKSVECVIKYRYKPFCPTEVTTAPSFPIYPGCTDPYVSFFLPFPLHIIRSEQNFYSSKIN